MDDENIAPVLLTVILAGGLHYLEIQAAIFCKCCGKYLPCYNWLMHKKNVQKIETGTKCFCWPAVFSNGHVFVQITKFGRHAQTAVIRSRVDSP